MIVEYVSNEMNKWILKWVTNPPPPKKKQGTQLQCKSLWIKASAKCKTNKKNFKKSQTKANPWNNNETKPILLYLSYSVSSIHGLQVSHGVPVVLHKHHSICSSQIQTQSTHMGSEQQNIYGRVIIEPVEGKQKTHIVTQINLHMRWNISRVVCVAVSPGDYRVSEAGLNASVQPEVGDCGQLCFEQILLHDVQHALQLTEDQNTVLGHHSLCAAISCSSRTQSTVQQQLQINILRLLRCCLLIFCTRLHLIMDW